MAQEADNSDDDLEDHERDQRAIRAAMNALTGRFESVTIFVNRYDPDDTTKAFVVGRGNCYARYGQVREWIESSSLQDVKSYEDEDGDDDKD